MNSNSDLYHRGFQYKVYDVNTIKPFPMYILNNIEQFSSFIKEL